MRFVGKKSKKIKKRKKKKAKAKAKQKRTKILPAVYQTYDYFRVKNCITFVSVTLHKNA